MRRAINVVVLLLILAITGGLVAVAILKVRDAASRTQCQNNIRLLGLSVENYVDGNTEFPLATIPNPVLPPDKRLSWLVSINPYVEASPLYKRTNLKEAWDASANQHLLLSLPYLQCPVSENEREDMTRFSSSYIGLSGLGDDAASLALGHPGAGCFGYERVWSPGLQKYAASHLIAIMETSQLQGVWSQGGPATVRGLPDETPTLGKSAPFGGLHQGGTNAGMADASCRFLSDSIDPGVLRKMATFAGSRRAAEEDEP